MHEIDNSSYARIEIQCFLCGSCRELTREEAEYTGTIYICDRCKSAIEWAKRQMDSD